MKYLLAEKLECVLSGDDPILAGAFGRVPRFVAPQ